MIKKYIKLFLFKKKWRRFNKHNNTVVKNIFNIKNVKVGKMSYGPLFIRQFGSKNEKLTIGSFCSIAENVTFLLGGHHNYLNISTFPFKAFFEENFIEAESKGEIVIGDDVWIGHSAIIMSGVKIGQGAIIGARSVVTRNVPPYAIVAGNPAKIIKYRFDEKIINKLLKIDFSQIDTSKITNNISYLYQNIEKIDIDKYINDFKENLY